MEKQKRDDAVTKMIAHRGLSGIEQENTIAAFIAAGNRGFYGMECDVRITKDGVFVICHDEHTGRVSPVRRDIRHSYYSELAAISLYDHKNKEPMNHLRIPMLREYLKVARKYNKHSFIEIKPEFTVDEAGKFCGEITRYGAAGMVTVISFNYSNLELIRGLNPFIPVQYLLEAPSADTVRLCADIKADASIFFQNADRTDIDFFHSRGVKVNVWTIDDIETAEKFIRWGVDFITTNILE